ncbi:MAG: hypothetical protein ABIP78_00215 [Pyrinomonadaceae bacterium]
MVQAKLPCVLDSAPAQSLKGVFGKTCETDSFRVVLSVKQHQNPFDEQTVAESFAANEMILKTVFGELRSFDTVNRSKNGFETRTYLLKLATGEQVKSRIFVTEFGTYDAMIGTKGLGKGNIGQFEFDSISDKFLESVGILKK